MVCHGYESFCLNANKQKLKRIACAHSQTTMQPKQQPRHDRPSMSLSAVKNSKTGKRQNPTATAKLCRQPGINVKCIEHRHNTIRRPIHPSICFLACLSLRPSSLYSPNLNNRSQKQTRPPH